MDIETKRASLNTLSIMIQALHVDGKQMTLAVFRQLPIRDCKTEGQKNWGVVRYAIKDEGDLWLVFSHQGKLYRQPLKYVDQYKVDSRRMAIQNAQGKLKIWKEYPQRVKEIENEIELATQLLADILEEQEYQRNKIQTFLDTLPQLFIAV